MALWIDAIGVQGPLYVLCERMFGEVGDWGTLGPIQYFIKSHFPSFWCLFSWLTHYQIHDSLLVLFCRLLTSCRNIQSQTSLNKQSECPVVWECSRDLIQPYGTLRFETNERVSSKHAVDAVHREPKAVRVECNLAIWRSARLVDLKDFIFNFLTWFSGSGWVQRKARLNIGHCSFTHSWWNSKVFCLMCGK